MSYTEYFTRNPGICDGEPVFQGTRVSLRTVRASLAEGTTIEEIVTDFPTLTQEHVSAANAFAAASAEEDLLVPGEPDVA